MTAWQLKVTSLWELKPWAACGGKNVARRGNWGELGPGGGGGGVGGCAGLGAAGVHTWGTPSLEGQPPGMLFQPEPPLCLFMSLGLRAPATHHRFDIRAFDLKDRKSDVLESLGRKVETRFLLMRDKKNPLVNTSLIKVVTACTTVILFLVVTLVLRCICFHQRWWDPTDVGGRLNNNKKQANKSLVLKYSFTYETTILLGEKSLRFSNTTWKHLTVLFVYKCHGL